MSLFARIPTFIIYDVVNHVMNDLPRSMPPIMPMFGYDSYHENIRDVDRRECSYDDDFDDYRDDYDYHHDNDDHDDHDNPNVRSNQNQNSKCHIEEIIDPPCPKVKKSMKMKSKPLQPLTPKVVTEVDFLTGNGETQSHVEQFVEKKDLLNQEIMDKIKFQPLTDDNHDNQDENRDNRDNKNVFDFLNIIASS